MEEDEIQEIGEAIANEEERINSQEENAVQRALEARIVNHHIQEAEAERIRLFQGDVNLPEQPVQVEVNTQQEVLENMVTLSPENWSLLIDLPSIIRHMSNAVETPTGKWVVKCSSCEKIFDINAISIEQLSSVCVNIEDDEFSENKVFVCPECVQVTSIKVVRTLTADMAEDWHAKYYPVYGWEVRCDNCEEFCSEMYPNIGVNAVAHKRTGVKGDAIYHVCNDCGHETFLFQVIGIKLDIDNMKPVGTYIVEDYQNGDKEAVLVPKNMKAIKAVRYCIKNTVGGIREGDNNMLVYCNTLVGLLEAGRNLCVPEELMTKSDYFKEIVIFKNRLGNYQQRDFLRVYVGTLT